MFSDQSTVFYAHPVVLSVPVLIKVISFLFKPSTRMQITSPVSALEPEPAVIEAPSPVCGESDNIETKQVSGRDVSIGVLREMKAAVM